MRATCELDVDRWNRVRCTRDADQKGENERCGGYPPDNCSGLTTHAVRTFLRFVPIRYPFGYDYMKPLRPILAANSSLLDVAGFFLQIVVLCPPALLYVVFKPFEPHQLVSGRSGKPGSGSPQFPPSAGLLKERFAHFIIPSWINYSHQLALSHRLIFRYVSGDPRGL